MSKNEEARTNQSGPLFLTINQKKLVLLVGLAAFS